MYEHISVKNNHVTALLQYGEWGDGEKDETRPIIEDKILRNCGAG
jgi:hypothetical protein